MTLALAIQYPYGQLREALESLSKIRPLQYGEAIIFLADSRFTYPNRREDDGVKLHDIDAHRVICFSGNVRIAEKCIEVLKSKRKIKSSHNKWININDTFRRTYRYLKKNYERNGFIAGRLSFLLGECRGDGTARLYLLESPNFEHKHVTGIEGIGVMEAYEKVKKIVAPKLSAMSYTGTEADYTTIAGIVDDAIRTLAIEDSNFKTIGGLRQCWVLDRRGITELSLRYTKDPTGKTDEWHRATAKRNELKTYKDKHNLRPDYH